jgi:SAM-dependent methyltransferase
MDTDRMKELVDLCKKNSRAAYDKLWNDEDLVMTYLEPARIEAYLFIIRYLDVQGHQLGRILELGFGSGDFLRLLDQETSMGPLEIYGLDYAVSAVRRAKKLIPKGKFVVGDIYRVPYHDDFFDSVFCIQTLEHLVRPERAIEEMDRVCKPDGRILITVPNGECDTFEGHVHFWNEPGLRRLLEPRELLDFRVYNSSRSLMAYVKPLKAGR